MVQKENKILLHSCCGICSGYPISLLKEKGYLPYVYFCNPNLDTSEEFEKRLEAQKKVCNFFDVELLVEEYDPNEYLQYVKGFETEPERGSRCDKCIELRLIKTIGKAKELNIKEFATTLIISPHKNIQKITEMAERLSYKNEVKYNDINFRKNDGFLKTNKISKDLGLYRQNYCGCIYAK